MRKKTLSWLLCLVMVLSMLAVAPLNAVAEGSLNVEGGSPGVDYTYESGLLTILESTPLTISGSTTDRIVVDAGVTANITLDNVSIIHTTADVCAFEIADGSTGDVSITLVGDNILQSGDNCAGLQKYGSGEEVGTLTIGGDGSLTVTGGLDSAGIGGINSGSSNNITIVGGIVKATGGPFGAGIGGGKYGGGNITITGGTVIATGGENGAGIGGGFNCIGKDNHVSVSGDAVVFAKGHISSNSKDIGYGSTGDTSNNSLCIYNTAAVFLFSGNGPDEDYVTCADGHTLSASMEYAESLYGIAIPTDWTGATSIGAYMRLVTLTYDVNDGVGFAPSSQQQHVCTGAVLPSGDGLSRTGYAFDSWNTQADGDGADYAAGGSFTLNADTTLYAKWAPEKYTVAFDPEGGTVSPTTNQVTYDSAYGALPTPTKAGFSFAGWWTGDNGTGTQITAADTVTTATNHTLYAKWTAKALASITLTAQSYTYDGAAKAFVITGTPGTGYAVEYYVGSSWTGTAPTDPGHYNVRITRAEDDTYAAYASGELSNRLNILAANVIYYDAEGTEHAAVSADLVTSETTALNEGFSPWYVVEGNVTINSTLTVSGSVNLILSDGASLTVNGISNNAGVNVSAGNSLTIYGQENGTGSLTATGGNNGAGIGSAFVIGNTCGTVIINGGNVTALGAGNGAGIGGGGDAHGGNVVINGGTVYARGNGAGIGGGATGYGSYLGGTGGTVTITGGTVTAISWGRGAGIGGGGGSSGVVNSGTGATVTISGDAVVYARGKELKDIGSGILHGTLSVSDMAAVFLYSGTAPAEGDVICADGHTLSSSISYADNLYGIALPSDWSGAANIGTYLRLTEITYDINGGNGTVPSQQQQHIGTTGTIHSGVDLSRVGHTYNGWNTQADGHGTDYTPGSSFSFDANMTLYAKWTGKAVASISQTAQSAIFDGTAKTFAITGTPETGFTVTYVQDAANVSPVNPGSYDVIISRAEDETYAAFSVTIENGLVITSLTVNIPAVTVTAPVRGAVPVSAVTETAQYTGVVSWEPAHNPFTASTEYTATITLMPKTGYTLMGVVEDFFTITGAASVSNEANSGVITAFFPATGAAPSVGGGGTPSTPSDTYDADVTAGDSSDSTLPVTVDTNNKTAAVEVNTEGLTPNGTVVTVPTIPDVDTYKASIPVPVLSASEGQGALTFVTGVGSVTIPSNMLTGVSDVTGSKAEISFGQGDKSALPEDVKAALGEKPLVKLILSVDGRQVNWNNPNAPVAVSVPYKPTAEELQNPESIVIWYIDSSGNVVTVPNGRYNPQTGTVTFKTTHFSNYAVSFNKVVFNDVADAAWYSNAVRFIAARDITTGTGNGKYNPDAKLTRGEFIALMMRAYGMSPDKNPSENFADAGDTYYTGYLAAAKRLGITAGVGNNMYAPGNQITRQEMFTLLYNALKVIGQLPEGDSGRTIDSFTDAGQIAAWAKDAMTQMVKVGAINGNNGLLKPVGTTTRAEMAQVLYNLLDQFNK